MKNATYTLITGACGGLGGAFTDVLAERGEPLFLTGRSEARLSELAEKIKAAHPATPVVYCACDLRSEEERAALFAYADAAGVRFRRLVYAAGVDTQMGLLDYDEGRLVFQSRVNLEGAASLMRGVCARADLDGTTELLAVGSMSASTPMPYFALYSATKKALEYFCVGVRSELKGRAKVTCVLPGGIPTREDIRENIKAHGFFGKISAKSPRAVALASLKAVAKNKRRKIVGFWNKVIWLTTRLTPLCLQLRFIEKRWKKTRKDHFAP